MFYIIAAILGAAVALAIYILVNRSVSKGRADAIVEKAKLEAEKIKQEKMNGFSLVVFSLIVAGALGNIIDSLFYGLIFSESSFFAVASAFPEGGGYAPFFFGKVVDMFYVKLFHIPDGFPLWGGSYFFPAIFNVADACITVGIFMMLIFNKRVLNMDVFQSKAKEAVPEKSVNSEDESVEPETIVESK